MNETKDIEKQMMEPMLCLYANAMLVHPEYMTIADAQLRHRLQIQPQETICVEHVEFTFSQRNSQ